MPRALELENPRSLYRPSHGHNPEAPGIEFEVNLPSRWNSKALQMGGGGYDGTLVSGLGGEGLQPKSTEHPLKQGYVTLGSDGGHKGGPASMADLR